MRGVFINGAVLSSRLNLMIAQRLASRDLQDRITAWADERAQEVEAVVPISRAIDGVQGATADALDVVHGAVISYTYPRLAQAVDMALREAQERSPDPGGAYSRAWMAVVNGEPWTDDIASIPSDATVWIVNFAPYARRLEQGWHKARELKRRPGPKHRPGLFITEAVRQLLLDAFPELEVEREFVPLTSAPGTNWPVPYILRRGDLAGEPILYPAVSLKQRR
jgi:hypothetical protein